MRNHEWLPRWTGANESVDVKRTKQEDEGVNRAEDHERDRRLARRQEWRHGIRGSQHPKDDPGEQSRWQAEAKGLANFIADCCG